MFLSITYTFTISRNNFHDVRFRTFSAQNVNYFQSETDGITRTRINFSRKISEFRRFHEKVARFKISFARFK